MKKESPLSREWQQEIHERVQTIKEELDRGMREAWLKCGFGVGDLFLDTMDELNPDVAQRGELRSHPYHRLWRQAYNIIKPVVDEKIGTRGEQWFKTVLAIARTFNSRTERDWFQKKGFTFTDIQALARTKPDKRQAIISTIKHNQAKPPYNLYHSPHFYGTQGLNGNQKVGPAGHKKYDTKSGAGRGGESRRDNGRITPGVIGPIAVKDPLDGINYENTEILLKSLVSLVGKELVQTILDKIQSRRAA